MTYLDWQRYHDLARSEFCIPYFIRISLTISRRIPIGSENFTTHAHSVQDGSHPSPPINPVVAAIADLQVEVEDVVAGFETRLRRITRGGARAFGTTEEESDDEEAPAPGDETVSILPIEESALPEHTQSPADVEVPPVVIGRGKEEVEAALNRVADLEGDKTSAPDDAQKSADSDAVAHALKEEIGGEAQARSVPSPPLHQEL